MFILGLAVALLAGTLVEYAVHRSLHGWLRKTWAGRFHLEHHAAGKAMPLWWELLAYQPVAAVAIPFGSLGGWEFFLGWAAGAVLYAAVMGATHWRQHEADDEYHTLHHRFPRTNYGVLTGAWDWAFKTKASHAESREG